MHMALFYYVFVVASVLVFAIAYMKVNWTEELFNQFAQKEEGEKR